MTAAPTRNLLLITFDQWRGDWCDPYAPIVELPNIASLAERGWTARRCYATSPQCVPVRLSWITGHFPSQLGVTVHRNVDLPPDAPSCIRTVRAAGWHTELVGKSHVSAHIKGRDLRDEEPRLRSLGFDRTLEVAGPRGLRHVECALTDAWKSAGVFERQRADAEARYAEGRTPSAWKVRPTVLPTELYPDIWIGRQAAQRISGLPGDRPWFLWVSFVGPHEPFDTPPPWAGRHRTAELPDPMPEPAWIKSLPAHAATRKTRERWEGLITGDAIDACRRDYADHLCLLDDQVGLLLNALEQRPDAGRTAVALTADHGDLLGDGGMLYKGAFLEGAVRVPWILRPGDEDGAPRATQCGRPVTSTDLLGKCLDALINGTSCAELATQTEQVPDACAEHETELMVVEGTRKLVIDRAREPLWAIDLAADPLEQQNVITEQPKVWRSDPGWKSLRKRARRHMAARRARRWRIMSLEDVS
ncbi:MAG: sulfatase family protein [Planctomycetota bacterium]|jgi:choline-sulfatase